MAASAAVYMTVAQVSLSIAISITVEPLNNGHVGPAILSFIERLSSVWRLKCTSIMEMGPQSVSFIERFFL